ncbi:MAG: SUMF1/EgtB/PvdO family nonheme iron enzyme [Candidatus Promineofilum sp.]|nr:SUMF1/EgtB/PvdO family nonheme iron enzyme [Promineifilum sp.]MCW5863751.1 SUMF1/EgtB/PvdO family nonheme iron enzyme [Anaerolineae bacterium]
MTLATGVILHNRYRIVKLVGQGGFGAVYRGWDTALDRPVAVKENFDTGPQAQRQFEREAKLLAGLRHPNLPVVIDHFILPGQGQYLVMDFVEGKSLTTLLSERGGPLDEAEVLPWMRQICAALTHLHTHTPPIVHRDIKPDNIIITDDGRAVLVDFGISKVYDPNKGTTIGAKAVTPGYSPPEQYGRGRTDPRTDVYALGATLYTLLTGQPPPDGPDLASGADVLTPPREINPAVSAATSAVVVAAMMPNISQRLDSTATFERLLAAGRPARHAPPPTPASALPMAPAPAPITLPPTLPSANPPAVNRSVPVLDKLLGVAALVALVALALWAWQFGGGAGSGPEPQTGDIRIVKRGGVVVEQVYVPAGSFMMGSEDGEENERPVHEVTLDAYWIDRTEVTNAQYAACVAAKACSPPESSSSYIRGSHYDNPAHADYPVTQVTWYNATAYAEWAGGRLPTEAQWEYAARGPESFEFPWGNGASSCRLANTSGCVRDISQTGAYPDGASWVGALDMAGNVSEWTNDWYDSGYYARSLAVNPSGPGSGETKALRGGSWSDDGRVAYRYFHEEQFVYRDVGFRLVDPLSDPDS